MNEPKEIVAGDTITWDKSISDYKASGGWTLTYYFWNTTKDFSVVAAADGDGYTVSISATISAAYTPGKYNWKSIVSKGTGETLERYTFEEGTITVLHNPAVTYGKGIDTRSETKKALDSIDAVLAGTATKEQASYTIAGRSITLRTVEELTKLRAHFARLYAKELRARKIEQGLGGKRNLIRFS
ncbi:MAG: hypothetical protein KKH94_11410 [Candidatus Omnitrophica bacterium]|nr:hypothetical protein [Candidatus Omnitrophota bacterium]